MDKMLDDPTAKSWWLQKLGLDTEEDRDKNRTPPRRDDEPRSGDKGDDHPNANDQDPVGNLTLSGKSAGTQANQWPSMPPYWWPPYPGPAYSGAGDAPSTSGHVPFMPPFLPQWFQQAVNTRKEGVCGKDGNAPGPSGQNQTNLMRT